MKLGSFASFANGTPMSSTAMDAVLLEEGSSGDSLFNALMAIDEDNLDSGASLPEMLLQFLPFPGAGGHDHDGSTSRLLGAGSIADKQINRSASTLIYTGMPGVILTKGVVNITTTDHSDTNGYWGKATIDIRTDGDYTYDNLSLEDKQVPVVIATTDTTLGYVYRQQVCVEHLLSGDEQHLFDIYLLSGHQYGMTVDVFWMAIGIEVGAT